MDDLIKSWSFWLFVVVLIIVMFCWLSGCVSAHYNPETNELSYWRIGDQKLGGVVIVFKDGSYITFESQISKAELLKALKLLGSIQ